jgi:hypothetical protein
MTKRNFQAKEYQKEELYNDTVHRTSLEEIESMKLKSCSSLSDDERYAIRYCLNTTFRHLSSGEWYDLPEIQVNGVKLKETLLKLLERM